MINSCRVVIIKPVNTKRNGAGQGKRANTRINYSAVAQIEAPKANEPVAGVPV